MARRRYSRRRSGGGGGLMRLAKPAVIGLVAGAVLGNSLSGSRGINGAIAAGALSGFGVMSLVAGYVGAHFGSGLLGGLGGSSGSAPGLSTSPQY